MKEPVHALANTADGEVKHFVGHLLDEAVPTKIETMEEEMKRLFGL